MGGNSKEYNHNGWRHNDIRFSIYFRFGRETFMWTSQGSICRVVHSLAFSEEKLKQEWTWRKSLTAESSLPPPQMCAFCSLPRKVASWKIPSDGSHLLPLSPHVSSSRKTLQGLSAGKVSGCRGESLWAVKANLSSLQTESKSCHVTFLRLHNSNKTLNAKKNRN